MDPRIDVVLACNSGTTQPSGLLPPLSNCSSALRSRPPSPGFGPFLSLNTGCGDFAPPAFPGRPNLELRSPRPVVRSLLTATGSRLPPFSAAPEVAVAVVGSTGNIQAHQRRVRLRAPGLAEQKVNHYFARNTQPHPESLTLVWRGREGQFSQVGTPALPRPASAGLPETGAFSIPSAPFSPPFLPRPSIPFHASPWSGLSPLSHLRSGFGRVTAGPAKTNFLCLEPDWRDFLPQVSANGPAPPDVLADWPEGDCARGHN